MAEERIIELDVGCRPEAAVSGATLFQDEQRCILTFNAMSNKPTPDGRSIPLGTAVMEFEGLELTRFGGPNDEGLNEHPLYGKGLKEIGYAVCEVLNSTWAKEYTERAKITAKRIWKDQYDPAYQSHQWVDRHFLVSFHDSTFECLARGFSLNVYDEPFDQTMRRVMKLLEFD